MPGRGLSASKGGSRGTQRPPSQRTQLTQLERLASRTRSRQRPPAQQLSEARGAPPRTSLQPQKTQSSNKASAALQATPGLASPVPKRGLDLDQIAGAHKPVGLALGSAHILATACQLSGSSPTAPCVPSPGPAPAASTAACMQGHNLWIKLLMPACACPINRNPSPVSAQPRHWLCAHSHGHMHRWHPHSSQCARTCTKAPASGPP